MSSFTSVCVHLARTPFRSSTVMAPPHLSAFAFETLELIFSFCDVATLAAVGRVSSACLELSVPFLYEHIVLSDHKTCELFFRKSRASRTQYLYHSNQPR